VTPNDARAEAYIGKSVRLKGELTGGEDLFIDGEVEGTVNLPEQRITVGPNGKINANVVAREVVVLGTIKGNVRAHDRVEIKKSGSMIGDLVIARISIEDGAFFKGSIDIQLKDARPTAAPSAPAHKVERHDSGLAATSAAASNATPAYQSSLLEKR
jgi:cytoskeletal protein CcmA (bactofilin family)